MNRNPNFELPEGYIRVRQPIVYEKSSAPPHINESAKICMDILNDVFKEEFLYPMFDPHFETDEKWVVKPDIFNKEKFKQVKP